MKQTTTFTFLLFAVMALISCRKDKYNPTIQQYDDDQIKAYISANGLTGMIRDTSGIYYKIINPGTGLAIDYTDPVSLVFSLTSVDGKYTAPDTLINHFQDFSGHFVEASEPMGINTVGLQEAIHNIANHDGAIVRAIIPSHLSYGVSGAGTGSVSNTAGRIAGNQCLDYYLHIIGKQDANDPVGHLGALQNNYDQLVIKNYITTNGLTNTMHQDPSGIWYSISIPGTGTTPITDNSTVFATFTTTLMDGTIITSQSFNEAGGSNYDIPDAMPGVQIALKKYATAGTLMSILIPSRLAYGTALSGVPQNTCLRYDVQVVSVAP